VKLVWPAVTLDKEDVEIAIVVDIDERCAGSHDLRHVKLTADAGVVNETKSRRDRHVDKERPIPRVLRAGA
jgi:hypothetical protein